MLNQQYSYVEFFRKKGDQKIRWQRVHSSKVEELRQTWGNTWDSYNTIQQFSNPERTDNEAHICPIYFDFDSATPDESRLDVIKVVQFFSDLGVNETFIRVWFSGKKGFHVTIEAECFGINAHPVLTYIYKLACSYVAELLNLNTFDTGVYSIPRQWRMTNTKHTVSGLYCVELYHSELNKSMDDIKEIAKQPREQLYDEEEYEVVDLAEEAKNWFDSFMGQYESSVEVTKLAPRAVIEPDQEGMPVCVSDLMENFTRKPGQRNYATMQLGCFYKDFGVPEDAAIEEITEWALGIPQLLSDVPDRQRVANVKSTVKSIYKDDKYHFSCACIRSIGKGTENPISCEYERCRFVKSDNQEMKEVIDVSLKESKRVAYLGKKLRFSAFCASKYSNNSFVPSEFDMSCTPDVKRENSPCHDCPMKDEGQRLLAISSKDPAIVEFIDASAGYHSKVARRMCGIPDKCKKVKATATDHVNVNRCIITPPVGFRPTTLGKPDEDFETIRSTIYVVNNDIKDNTNYQFVGYSMAHPKDSTSIHVIESLEPEQMDLDHFNVTQKITDELAVFEGEPEEKMKEIHKDLEHNVHHIWGRGDMAVGLDLVYHSALSFNFQGKHVTRGWVQAAFVGDTGQAKSEIALRLMEHYNCGTFINCETSARTGLLYNLTKMFDSSWHIGWGRFVSNDRLMVVLDEVQKLPEGDLEELGGAREYGFVQVDKVATGQASTRIRLIMLANPRGGQCVAAYAYKVKALAGLFTAPKDIRRCDFGLVIQSNTVDIEEINKKHVSTVQPVFTSDRCTQLLLWIWSRRADQVIIEGDTVDAVLKSANFLGGKYNCNISLCEPGDMRLKVARLAASCAGRLHSTKTGEEIIVLPEHVAFVTDYIDSIYSSPSMGFDIYAKMDQRKNVLDEKRKKIVGAWLKGQNNWKLLANSILESFNFSANGIAEMWNEDRRDASQVISFLKKYYLIEQNQYGKYFKTPALNDLLRLTMNDAGGYDPEEDDSNRPDPQGQFAQRWDGKPDF